MDLAPESVAADPFTLQTDLLGPLVVPAAADRAAALEGLAALDTTIVGRPSRGSG
jgi:hypothetical protein